jgi:hypothetical protein
VKHPRWIDLTLSAGADVPLLLQGEGQQGEVCHLQFVMLTEAQRSEASTHWMPHCVRSDGAARPSLVITATCN